ncbi:MAG: NRDE family protein [Flavobacteriaceae bacterium]|nr:NRDE family protein [Flavobacteriaceae bacterium]
MCTVSFIPLTDERFIFTSNRDENPNRAATALHEMEVEGKTLFFPQDAQAKGSWFVFSNTNQFVCVLNGAFEPHLPEGSYRLSRGKMAVQFFEYADHRDFINTFEFEGMEPFTFIIYDQGTLIELRWDEKELHEKVLSTAALHLWSSATLYPTSWQKTRFKLLKNWTEQKERTHAEVMDFQRSEFPFERSALEAIYGDLVPDDVPVETLSVSSIHGNKNAFEFQYKRKDASVQLEKSVQIK